MILRIVTIDGATPRKDKSISLRMSTLEQTPTQAAELFSLMGKMAVVAIKEDAESFSSDEMDSLDSIDVDLYDKGKSPSKRLRNTLHVLYQQELGRKPTDEEFKEYYRVKMEQLITHFKDKLED